MADTQRPRPARAPTSAAPRLPRRPTTATALLASALVAALGATGHAPTQAQTPAAAQATPVAFDIPAGPLEPALTAFARTSGVLLAYTSDLVRGLQSPGLQGSHAPAQALAALLADTGLQAVVTGTGTYTLRRAAPAPAPAPAAVPAAPIGTDDPTLKEVKVTAQAARDGSTEGSGSYAPATLSVGKGQQALKDVPQSITVISRQRIDDQGLRSIDDVMGQAAGVSMTTNGIYGSNYVARGLNVNRVRYDGGAARSNVLGFYTRNGDDDMAPFDHVEVLRGADGLFSGTGEAGGVVNMSYKRPTPAFQAHGELALGRWNNRRVEADLSGPLALEGRVRGRLVAAHQDRDYFYDHGHRRSSVLYGALEIDLGPDTRLFTGIDHQSVDERGTSWGHPRYRDGSPLQVDRSTNFTAPWSWANTARTITFAQLEHQLNANWQTQMRVEHYDATIDHHTARLGGPIEPADPRGRYWGASWDGGAKHVGVDLLLKGGFDWLGRRHDVTLGMDWSRTKADFRFKNPDFGGYVETGLDPIVIPPMPEKFLGGPQEIVDIPTTQHGLYGTLQLRPFEHWTLIAGARYTLKDRHDDRRDYPLDGESTRTVRDEGNVLVPYFGVVRALGEHTNVYASATEIYTSQATRLGGPLPGTPLDPVRGSNYELGVKHELSNRLTASAALYRIEKKGMAVADPAYPNTPGELGSACCYYRDGYQVSEGVDLELNGELIAGWQFSAGYTWNNNVNRRANDARFSTITPKHLFKLWTQYQFRGDARGLRLGAGVVTQSSSYNAGSVNLYNPDTDRYDGPSVAYRFTQAGYAVWSARAEYVLSRNASVSLNVNNLFDKIYFRSVSGTTNGNYYGDPRNAVLRLQLKY